MIKVNKLEDQKIEDLLDITYTIQLVYEQLIEATIKKDEKKYQESLESLNMCVELENKFYQRISIELEQQNRVLNRINYLNIRRESDIYQKDLVMARISNYLNIRSYRNPFLSMEIDPEVQKSENELTIYVQYYFDVSTLFIHLLNKAILEVSSNITAAYLIREKYENILFSKSNEQKLLALTPQTDINLTGRTNCLLFQQDKNLVQTIYTTETFDLIKSAISNYFIEQELSNSINEEEYFNYLFIIKIESALSLLNEQEQKEIWDQLWEENILNKSTNRINNLILNIFSKVKNNSNHYNIKSKERMKK